MGEIRLGIAQPVKMVRRDLPCINGLRTSQIKQVKGKLKLVEWVLGEGCPVKCGCVAVR